MDQNIILGIGILIIFILFININNLIMYENMENFQSKSIINKTYFESYFDYNKKVYEYVMKKKVPNKIKQNNINLKPNTISDYYNKINKGIKELYSSNNCGFKYKYYESESLIPGSIYLTESGIVLTIMDLNNNGINLMIEDNITFVISDNLITYQIKKEKFNIDTVKGIITIFIQPKSFIDNFFKPNKQYILYPCMITEHVDNVPTATPVKNIIEEFLDYNNILRTLGFFILLLVIIILIYNWKYIYIKVSGFFKKNPEESLDLEESEPVKIYIGGYDNKDYSE